jgi:hypothetical protein
VHGIVHSLMVIKHGNRSLIVIPRGTVKGKSFPQSPPPAAVENRSRSCHRRRLVAT